MESENNKNLTSRGESEGGEWKEEKGRTKKKKGSKERKEERERLEKEREELLRKEKDRLELESGFSPRASISRTPPPSGVRLAGRQRRLTKGETGSSSEGETKAKESGRREGTVKERPLKRGRKKIESPGAGSVIASSEPCKETVEKEFEGIRSKVLEKLGSGEGSDEWMVKQVNRMGELFRNMAEIMEKGEGRMILQRINEVKEISESIKTSVKKIEDRGNFSYASVTRGREEAEGKRREKDFVALMYPEGEDIPKTSKDTRERVKALIDPVKDKIKVSGIHAVRNGGVAIRTKDRESMNKVLSKGELKEAGLGVREPRQRDPMVIVKGIPVGLTEAEFYHQLRDQNFGGDEVKEEDLKAKMKFRFKKGRRERETCCWVFSVTPDVRKTLLSAGRVYLNWLSCWVDDFIDVTRCAKCLGYGHIARACREAKAACGHCGEEGHVRAGCPGKDKAPSCTNCRRVGRNAEHEVSDRCCPAFRGAVDRAERATNYE